MKKKKLKKRIKQLERERNSAELHRQDWKNVFDDVFQQLLNAGVILISADENPEPPTIHCETLDGNNKADIHGMKASPLKFELDFSKHDAEVLERQKNESNP